MRGRIAMVVACVTAVGGCVISFGDRELRGEGAGGGGQGGGAGGTETMPVEEGFSLAFGEKGTDGVRALVVDPSGDLLVLGQIAGAVEIGDTPIPSPWSRPTGYVLRLSPDGDPTAAGVVGASINAACTSAVPTTRGWMVGGFLDGTVDPEGTLVVDDPAGFLFATDADFEGDLPALFTSASTASISSMAPTSAGFAAAGAFQEDITIDGQTFLAPAGSIHGYVSWHDQVGALRGSVLLEAAATSVTSLAALPADEEVVVTGSFTGSLAVVGASEDKLLTSITPAGYVGKLALPGSTAEADGWLVRLAGDAAIVRSAATDGEGSVYATGSLTGASTDLDLDAGPFAPDADVFVVKYEADGATAWSLAFRGEGAASGYGIAVRDDVVLVTGDFARDLVVTPRSTLSANPRVGIFVVALDAASGAVIGAKAYRGTGNASGMAIAPAGPDEYFLAGTFEESIDLGFGEHKSEGSIDVFVARLPDPSPVE